MALTVSNIFGLSPGQQAPVNLPLPGFGGAWLVEYTCDNSYPTGGYTLVLPAGLSTITALVPLSANAVGLLVHWDQANQKILLFFPTGSTLAAGTTLADPIINAGGTAVTGSAATGPFAAGRGKQLGNTTDASTVKIYCLMIGR